MKDIEVLLREHVRHLGRCGDVVRVAPGYARNFLLPRGLASPATEDNKRQIVRRVARLALEEAEKAEEVAVAVALLSELTVTAHERADENGHLYGSVPAAAIAEMCTAAGTEIDVKRVHLDAPIKVVGEHKVSVHVHGESYAQITVRVEAEGVPIESFVEVEPAEEPATGSGDEPPEEPAEEAAGEAAPEQETEESAEEGEG
jgi:large subunit ribosomal protein L9